MPSLGFAEESTPARPRHLQGSALSISASRPSDSVGWLLLSLGSLALRSFRLSTALFTTTASADSSDALALEASPGKVHELSTRAVRLYLMCLSVAVGFRVR